MESDDVDITCLDFSKAFDMESHYCLLVNIKNLSISKKYSEYCQILFNR